MARPQKVIQQRPNGMFFVRLQVPDPGNPQGKPRRLTKSLETNDPVLAHRRAAQAIQELQEEAQSAHAGLTKWREPAAFKQLVDNYKLGGDLYATVQAAGLPLRQVGEEDPTAPTPEDFIDPEARELANSLVTGRVQVTWHDLMREAVKVRKQKTGTDYGENWYFQANQSSRDCPFSPAEATPDRIREWMKQIHADGLHADKKIGALSFLVKTCRLSGYLKWERNPFDDVDYARASDSGEHIPTAEKENYELIGKVLRETELETRTRLSILICVYTGVRHSEIAKRTIEDFDFEESLMYVHAAKNKTSQRQVPLPRWLSEEIKEFGLAQRWPVNTCVNKYIKRANTEDVKVTSHSWRHGISAISYSLDSVENDAIQVFTGHALRGMKYVYGTRKGKKFEICERYPLEAVRRNAERCWAVIDEWMGDSA